MTIQPNQQSFQTFLDQVVSDLAASYGGVMVSIGDKLGLYKAMHNVGPLSSAEIAARAKCSERYVREWLNSQAASGYVRYHPASGTYELTPEQAAVFADEESPVFFPPAWEVPASMWLDEEKTIDAFRTGNGVPWSDHDGRLFCGVAAFFRNGYRANLVDNWLPALDGVTAKLKTGARVADIGCGHGHSTIFMAKAFPKSAFLGIDTHEGSLSAARRNAEEAGVADRVTFEHVSADAYAKGKFDLICFFDCLHDMGHPDAAARHARTALADNGTVMLVEPFAGNKVEDNLNPIGKLYYSASTTMCCAHAISEKGNYALGAQAGETQLREIFTQAGFSTFRLATETPFNLVLEARL
ncbi:MAG: class I SAM-dependent methyltransferase [Parvibaculum sp.]|uniref:class I SAM-dependent methyltransferase n=1 Tax=Parvibaculum sp. TaxID=2024848 RepID=UPI0034A07083